MLRSALLCASLLAVPVVVSAQVEPGPPGPYVFDLHGAMLGVPNAGEFYPSLPEAATIPGRGFGFDVGAHVLVKQLGASRLGFGVSAIGVRGYVTDPSVEAKILAVAPQISLNFGTRDGWSYLSVGYGLGRISTRASAEAADTDDDEEDEESSEEETPAETPTEEAEPVDTTLNTGSVGTLNFGGGARWFMNSHVATSFDVRLYRLAASPKAGTPATMRVAVTVGVSVR